MKKVSLFSVAMFLSLALLSCGLINPDLSSSSSVSSSSSSSVSQVDTPVADKASGTYTNSVSVKLSCATSNSTISWSTNGGSSWVTNDVLTINRDTTLLAKAFGSGYSDSAVLTNSYQFVYIVSFDAMGGSSVFAQIVFYGGFATNAISMKTNEALLGWYKDTNCTAQWNFSSDVVTAPVTLYAGWAAATAGLEFTLTNGGTAYSVTAGDATNDANIIIPDNWQGIPVTDIVSSAFYSNTILTNIVLPNSIVSIGSNAFYQCTGLTNIVLPNSIVNIGDYAFAVCTGLTNIVLPNSIVNIGDYAFGACTGLTNIVLPSSLTSIGEGAFYDCTGLSNIVLPSSLTNIGDWTFSYCAGLTNIVLPSSLTSIGDWTFNSCAGLTNIVLPSSLTNIGEGAFYDCTGLTNIVLPSSLTNIGYKAFYACTGLANVSVNATNPPTLGTSVFDNCSELSNIAVPAGSVSVYQSASGWNDYSNIIVSQ